MGPATATRAENDWLFSVDVLWGDEGDGGTDGVDAVRITVYRLPQSHLVWLGWGMMLLGMAALGLRNVGQTPTSSAAV